MISQTWEKCKVTKFEGIWHAKEAEFQKSAPIKSRYYSVVSYTIVDLNLALQMVEEKEFKKAIFEIWRLRALDLDLGWHWRSCRSICLIDLYPYQYRLYGSDESDCELMDERTDGQTFFTLVTRSYFAKQKKTWKANEGKKEICTDWRVLEGLFKDKVKLA